jgi:heavy metal sensor kinase
LFRLKIALLSALLSGLVLVGLGIYSLSVMNRVALDRMDREILTLGEGHLATRPSVDYWQNFGTSLRFMYGEERLDQLIVQIRDARNEILFQSPNWPAAISPDSFPEFDRTLDPRSPVQGDPEGRRGPPPEAYRACAGKSAGNVAQFTDSRGETVMGTCEKEENGVLVLRPDANRRDRRAPAHEGSFDPPSAPPPESKEPRALVPRVKKKPFLSTMQTPSGAWRIGIMGSDRITIMVGISMAGFYEDASRYRGAFLGTIPIALILLAAGGWVIARRALEPVALITRTAEAITVRALGQRVPLIGADRELSRLVEVINGMLDRLEKSFRQAVRFSADAAHELQTPLTILQGELDDAVQHAAVGSEEQQRYSDLLEEVQRLKAVVQKLLILARADAGRLNLCLEEMDLTAMVESAAEDATVMAPHLKVERQIAPGVIVKADPDLMGQALRNLLSNAVKYNRDGGTIRFQLSVRDHKACVTISNTAAPIPEKDRERIFDRFYRVDPSRNKAVPGSGLGLTLVREIVTAHQGEIRLNPAAGNVVSFTLSLPCSSC